MPPTPFRLLALVDFARGEQHVHPRQLPHSPEVAARTVLRCSAYPISQHVPSTELGRLISAPCGLRARAPAMIRRHTYPCGP